MLKVGMIHFGRDGGTRETQEEFERRKARALGWHVELPDALENQVTFIAGEEVMFADGSLTRHLRQLHPKMDETGIQTLVGRVLSIRHPEQADNTQKPGATERF